MHTNPRIGNRIGKKQHKAHLRYRKWHIYEQSSPLQQLFSLSFARQHELQISMCAGSKTTTFFGTFKAQFLFFSYTPSSDVRAEIWMTDGYNQTLFTPSTRSTTIATHTASYTAIKSLAHTTFKQKRHAVSKTFIQVRRAVCTAIINYGTKLLL